MPSEKTRLSIVGSRFCPAACRDAPMFRTSGKVEPRLRGAASSRAKKWTVQFVHPGKAVRRKWLLYACVCYRDVQPCQYPGSHKHGGKLKNGKGFRKARCMTRTSRGQVQDAENVSSRQPTLHGGHPVVAPHACSVLPSRPKTKAAEVSPARFPCGRAGQNTDGEANVRPGRPY